MSDNIIFPSLRLGTEIASKEIDGVQYLKIISAPDGPTNQVTPINKSGTITSGGNAQVFAAANANRKGFRIRNVSDTSLWLSTTGTAVADQTSFELKTGEYFESPYSIAGAISIIGATTGQAFFGEEW